MRKLMMIAGAVILMGSCSKDDNSGTGNNNAVSLIPNTNGSTWNYDTKDNILAVNGSYQLKATAKDTSINSKTYRVFTNSSGANEYFNHSTNDYYQFGTLPGLSQSVELLNLKDAAAGTKWTETKSVTYSGFPMTVVVNYEVAEKGIAYTANGKNYTDVTHIKITIGSLIASGLPIPTTSEFNYYYARGIGRIYSRVKLTAVVALLGVNISKDDETTLTGYTIL